MEASLSSTNSKTSLSQFIPLTKGGPLSVLSVVGSSQRGSSYSSSLTTPPTTANVVDSRRHFSLSHSPPYSDSQFSSQSSQSTCSSFPTVVSRPNKYYQTPEQRNHDNCEILSFVHRQQAAFDGILEKLLCLSSCNSYKEN
jgi:hypothetical protein